jgi:hypothetical protein
VQLKCPVALLIISDLWCLWEWSDWHILSRSQMNSAINNK